MRHARSHAGIQFLRCRMGTHAAQLFQNEHTLARHTGLGLGHAGLLLFVLITFSNSVISCQAGETVGSQSRAGVHSRSGWELVHTHIMFCFSPGREFRYFSDEGAEGWRIRRTAGAETEHVAVVLGNCLCKVLPPGSMVVRTRTVRKGCICILAEPCRKAATGRMYILSGSEKCGECGLICCRKVVWAEGAGRKSDGGSGGTSLASISGNQTSGGQAAVKSVVWPGVMETYGAGNVRGIENWEYSPEKFFQEKSPGMRGQPDEGKSECGSEAIGCADAEEIGKAMWSCLFPFFSANRKWRKGCA